jgi:hypothetical protein
MTINSSARRSTSRGAYNPLTRQDVQPSQESSLFAGLESTSSRTLGGLLFAVIFLASRGVPEIASVLTMVLLICLLYRMDERERRIAAIPLAFGAVRLVFSFTAHLMQFSAAAFAASSVRNDSAFLEGAYWLPLLFAAYLFYSPWKESHTSRLIFWYSAALLLSGLLPGEGYLCVWYAGVYTAFFAIGVALILDFAGGASSAPRPLAPAQPAPASQPAALS